MESEPKNTNDLQTYYDIFKTIPTLSGADERKCLLKIKKGNKEAYQHFLLANMRLVISRALNFAPRDDPRIMDFVAEGTLGLIRAVERFDCGRNLRFSTYAVGWIESYIRKAIRFFQKETQSTIKILKKKFSRAEELLRCATGEQPTDEEVANFLNWPPYLLLIYKRHSDAKVHVSHDSLILDDAPSMEDHPEHGAEQKDVVKKIANLLHYLTPVEEDILRRHYGIGHPEETYMTIANFYSIAKERVRQIENDALRKLYAVIMEKENPFGNLPGPEGASAFDQCLLRGGGQTMDLDGLDDVQLPTDGFGDDDVV